MLKKLLFTLSISAFFITTFGQTIYINPGSSISKLDWALYPGSSEIRFFEKPLFSYGVTAGIEYLERKNFSLASEILFYESGGVESGEDNHSGYSEQEDQKAKMQYLS